MGAQQIGPADVDRMQTEYELMRAAIAERRVVALLDHDEALLTILYEAAANPVLVDSLRSLWQHCRAYKIVGAQGTLDTAGDDSLWRYQERLVEAARKGDADAAVAVNNESLIDDVADQDSTRRSTGCRLAPATTDLTDHRDRRRTHRPWENVRLGRCHGELAHANRPRRKPRPRRLLHAGLHPQHRRRVHGRQQIRPAARSLARPRLARLVG